VPHQNFRRSIICDLLFEIRVFTRINPTWIRVRLRGRWLGANPAKAAKADSWIAGWSS